MTEEPGPDPSKLYNYSARPGPPGRAGPQFKKSARARPGPARPAFGPARLTPLMSTASWRVARRASCF